MKYCKSWCPPISKGSRDYFLRRLASQVGTQEGCTGDEDDVTSGLNGEGRAVISIEIRATKSGWHALSAVDDSLHGVEETKRRNTMMLITLAKQY